MSGFGSNSAIIADWHGLPDYMNQAACAGTLTPEWWELYQSDETNEAAARVCQTCPVKTQCRDLALANPWMIGVWGGLLFFDNSYGPRRKNGREGHPILTCGNGHPRTEENTGISKNGWKFCYVCSREGAKRHYQRRMGSLK